MSYFLFFLFQRINTVLGLWMASYKIVFLALTLKLWLIFPACPAVIFRCVTLTSHLAAVIGSHCWVLSDLCNVHYYHFKKERFRQTSEKCDVILFPPTHPQTYGWFRAFSHHGPKTCFLIWLTERGRTCSESRNSPEILCQFAACFDRRFHCISCLWIVFSILTVSRWKFHLSSLQQNETLIWNVVFNLSNVDLLRSQMDVQTNICGF